MLRPKQMSKVSVTGSKTVMDDVIETAHGLNLLHLSDYDGSWEGFDPGNPVGGADDASEKLVTVRSLESILDVSEEDAGPSRIVTDEAIEEELASVREQANTLDDRRDDVETELRSVEDAIDAMEPFADLGIDLDLLSGYDSLEVAVGTGNAEAIRGALGSASGVDAFEVFTADGGDALAAFVQPHGDQDVLDDALVGVEFTRLEIPEVETDGSTGVSPDDYLDELRSRRQRLQAKLDTVQNEIEELRLDAAGFLLAAEEKLSIDVQKREAPLQFATTENSFIAEGWIPTEQYGDLVEGLRDAVGDHVEIEELERAEYDPDGHPTGHGEEVDHGGSGQATATDGGTTMTDDPPVIQDNPGAAKPFELLVEMINRPKYTEYDPTVILLLTFPAFYGFMIGDLGYGILYTALGYWLYTSLDSPALKSLGGIAMWAGGFTALFGVLYGEFFGLHILGDIVWGGKPPMHKGLQPHYSNYALTWLFVSLLVGLLHVTLGHVLSFLKNLAGHGFKDAIFESGSWIAMIVGIWAWVVSKHTAGVKPAFMIGQGSVFNGNPYALGFTGLPAEVGLAGLALFGVGLVLLVVGEPIEAVEFLDVLVNVLSYARLAAVLLAKAGMAFVVNLLFFGVYVTGSGADAEWHFGLGHMPHAGDMVHGHEVTGILFGGLLHSGIAGVVVGLLILVIGHLLVLALGVTSAGLQAVRLEYVEFFGKFYDGGGEKYEPFGYQRRYTTED